MLTGISDDTLGDPKLRRGYMRKLARFFATTAALSAVALLPTRPMLVATGWARPGIIGTGSVSVLPFSTHTSASAGMATAGTVRARQA